MPTANKSSQNSFGKRWNLSITTLPDGNQNQQLITIGSDGWIPEPLEIEFEVYQTIDNAYWFAEITVWNLNQPTEQVVLKQGMTVKLDAGYQTGPGYGTIFEGTLFQPTWERVNGVDTKLTLHCIVGLVENTNNFVAFNCAAGLNQRDIVSRMAASPNIAYPLNVDNVVISNKFQQTRGAVFFDQPGGYLQQIATQNTSNLWITNRAANIRQLVDETEVPTLLISQETGLIGTPQQTQDGVEIRINLDARALLRTQVQLSPDTNIKQLQRVQGNYPTVLDAQGKYAIAAVRHFGNSRGNEWESTITGITYIGTRLGLQPPY